MADRLSLPERMDLANDPRMKDPGIRFKVFQTLSPEDQQWVTEAMNGPAPPSAPGAMQAGANLVGNVASGAMNYARTHPVETGALVGGIAAPILTGGAALLPELAAAGLGGAGGAGLGMLTGAATGTEEALPTTPGGVLKTMAAEGGGQMAGAGMGRAIGGTLKGGANLLMNESVPADIAKSFPNNNLGEWLNVHGINPTTQRGAAQARVIRKTAGAAQRQLAEDATAAGAPGITAADLAPFLSNANREAAEQAQVGVAGGQQAVSDRLDALMSANPTMTAPPGAMGPNGPGEIPLSAAPAVTRQLQKEGKIVRKAVNAGQMPSDISAIAADDLANGVRRLTADRVPGYADAARDTQDAVGGAQVAEKMSKMPIRIGGFGTRLAAGALAGGGLLGGEPLVGLGAAALPLAWGTPQISAPIAINMYRAGKLPYSMLIKAVSPQILKMLGITEPTAAQAALNGQTP